MSAGPRLAACPQSHQSRGWSAISRFLTGFEDNSVSVSFAVTVLLDPCVRLSPKGNQIHSLSQQQASDWVKCLSNWIRRFSRCLQMKPLMSAPLDYAFIVASTCSVSLFSAVWCTYRDVFLLITAVHMSIESGENTVWLASCRDKYLSLSGVSLKDNNQQCLKNCTTEKTHHFMIKKYF